MRWFLRGLDLLKYRRILLFWRFHVHNIIAGFSVAQSGRLVLFYLRKVVPMVLFSQFFTVEFKGDHMRMPFLFESVFYVFLIFEWTSVMGSCGVTIQMCHHLMVSTARHESDIVFSIAWSYKKCLVTFFWAWQVRHSICLKMVSSIVGFFRCELGRVFVIKLLLLAFEDCFFIWNADGRDIFLYWCK